MMRCFRCRKTISGPDVSKMKLIHDDQGHLEKALHYRCWFLYQREQRLLELNRESAPTAYEAKSEFKNADDMTVEARARREAAEVRLTGLLAIRDKGYWPPFKVVPGSTVSLDDLISQQEKAVYQAKRQEKTVLDKGAAREEAEAKLAGLIAIRDQGGWPVDTVGLDEMISDQEQRVILAVRQEQKALDEALEQTPAGWADWRDPTTGEV